MSLSIEELDATVNAFYNGKGEAVSETSSHVRKILEADYHLSKSKPRPPSIRYAIRSTEIPKNRKLKRDQFKENPDSWLIVDKILSEATNAQSKCTSVWCANMTLC